MSYTPGPWYVFPPGEFSMWHVGPAGHSIAYVRFVDDFQANTQLIAAAPDMLKALELLVDTKWEDLEYEHPAWEAAYAAIKKAKGVE